MILIPLTHAENRVYLTQKRYPEFSMWNCPFSLRFAGVDLDRLARALDLVVASISGLKVIFTEQDGVPGKYLDPDRPVPVDRQVFSDEAACVQWMKAQSKKILPMLDALPYRLALVSDKNGTAYFYLNFHHIATDGRSIDLFLGRVAEAYEALGSTNPVEFPVSPPLEAAWESEQAYLQSSQFEADREFWNTRFDHIPDPLDIAGCPGSKPLPLFTRNHHFSPETTRAVLDFCQDRRVSPFRLVLAAMGAVLSRVLRRKDIVLGTATTNRFPSDLTHASGMFVNSCPLRLDVDSDQGFSHLVRDASQAVRDTLSHGRYPYDRLMEDIRERTGQIPDFMDATLVEIVRTPYPGNVEVEHYINYDSLIGLTAFLAYPRSRDEDLHIQFILAGQAGRFEPWRIKDLAEMVEQAVLEGIRAPGTPVRELRILPRARQHEQGGALTGPLEFRNARATLVLGVEKITLRYPGHKAVVYRGRSLTYGELDLRSAALARNLIQSGVVPGSVVGLMADRCLDIIVAQLAILKAGAAFMPVDPGYPDDRIRYMLDDIAAPVMVTRKPFMKERDFGGARLLNLDDQGLFSHTGEAPLPQCTPQDLACVIYTSGSTGNPKGVTLTHQSIANIILHTIDAHGVTVEDRVAKHASFSFDASLLEIFTALMSGAQLHIIPDEIRLSLSHLNEYFEAQAITWAFLTTQLGEQFMEFLDNRSLKTLVVGGEKLRTFRPRHYRLVNIYGPTECAIYVTKHEVTEMAENIPIGGPVANTTVLILDDCGHVQPPGYSGELCVLGPGLARGYHNRPGKTAECFVPCPLDAEKTMYRTGDLACQTPEGTILHMGRMDRQVKLRGFRIELGEIENAMLGMDGVEEAAVADFKDSRGRVYLCGYVCGSADSDLVSAHLRSALPAFMVPSRMVRLDAMPINPSGKIDRKKLLPPEEAEQGLGEDVPPETELEKALARIWGLALDREPTGATANFFQYGGDSLRAVTLQMRLSRDLNRNLDLSAIFEHPTPRALAAFLEENREETSIPKAAAMADYPTTVSQQQLYLLSRMAGIGTAYNMPVCLGLDGPLDARALSEALLTLMNRHESLRTAFVLKAGRCVQKIREDVYLKLESGQSKTDDPDRIARGFVRPFDLERPPLMRAKLVAGAHGQHWLLLDFHHIAFDGVSLGIFLRELFEAYQGNSLAPLPLQHKDVALWEANRAESVRARHQGFWFSLFDSPPEAELPTDFPRPGVQSFEGDVFRHPVDAGLSGRLRTLARNQGASLHQVFMAGLSILLSRWTGKEDVCLGTSMSGRGRAGTDGVVGMFVRTLPFRSRPRGQQTFAGLLAEVRNQMQGLHEHGEYPISSLYEHLGLNRGPGRHPLFDINFVMRNTGVGSGFKIGDLKGGVEIFSTGTAKFDISFAAEEEDGALTLEADFRTALYRRDTIVRMTGHLCRILEVAAGDPGICLDRINMLLPREEEDLRHQFNPPRTPPPAWPTVCQAILAQARAMPDHTAVVAEDGTLTYGELEALASRAAVAIQAKGGGRDTIVAVVADRSTWSVAGMLAALKAGAAFVGLDVHYPPDRISLILEETKAPCVVGSCAQLSGLGIDAPSVVMDGPLPHEGVDPSAARGGEDLAYCIFTSGSTGQPKGVLIEHHAMVNFIHWYANHHRMTPESACAAFAAFSFDVSVVQVFAPLVSGAALHVIPETLRRSPVDLDAYFEANQVTHAHFPTQFAEQFMRLCPMKSLRYLIVGGDRLRSYTLGDFRLTNEYGPSETAMACLSYDVHEPMAKPPVGYPVANTRIYILDGKDRLCPIGVPGEICVAGRGVGRGYLNRPDLTAKVFWDDPFVPGERMFRTGDKGTWLPDGMVDFIGRMDFQVKIRGYRVEPGEIEARIREDEQVRDCVVTALEDPGGNKVLAAYITGEADVESIRRALKTVLPDYMVPAHLVAMETLPLNPNGKVDRARLPRPEIAGPVAGPFAPRNPEEERIAKAWETVLGHGNFGLHDGFYDIGGDSLSAITLLAELSDTYDIGASDLFAFTTVADQAAHFKRADTGRAQRLLRLKALADPVPEDPAFEEQVAAYEAARAGDKDLDTDRVKLPDHVLLTGATGTLGIYLLRELLCDTRARITAIVRADDHASACQRLEDHFLDRFDTALDTGPEGRVDVVAGDLSSTDLGLSPQTYDRLASRVDAILHSAALTRHYGDWEDFVRANISSVENLARFAGEGRPKHLHHLSTTSIGSGEVAGRSKVLFTEFDTDLGQETGNLYVRSKLAAEKQVAALRDQGLAVTVYRAGNITSDSKTGMFQRNVGDNAFFQQLRAYVNLGTAPDGTDVRNFSYVDQAARAVVTAMTRPGLSGQTLHIQNPHLLSLSRALCHHSLGLNTRQLSFGDFVAYIAAHAGCPGFDRYIERLLLHLGWQDWLAAPDRSTRTHIRGDRSVALLEDCGFSWKRPGPQDLERFVIQALQDRVDALERVPGFKALGRETLAAVARRVIPAFYPAEALIQQEGRPVAAVSLVMEGMVETFRRSASGWIGTVRISGAGACMGEEGVFEDSPANHSVEALDPTLVFRISLSDMRQLILDHPRLGMALVHLSSIKANQAERLFIAV